MAGRRTFFSFHYDRDVWRASIVRNSGVVDASAAAGWSDSSLWEEAKRKGDAAIGRLIDAGLEYTTVTVVLIGAQTASRRWVGYEIEKSIERGNGILGVRIHMLGDKSGRVDTPGAVPSRLSQVGAPCYNWDSSRFGSWVEAAAVRAGHQCLRHARAGCQECS